MTSAESNSVAQLLAGANLAEVVTFELAAQRADGSDFGDSNESTVEFQSSYQLKVGVSEDNTKIQIRLSLKLTSARGSIACEVGARFDLPQATPLEPDNEQLFAFANETGIHTLYPYIRQYVSDLGLRVLGLPVLLPIPGPSVLQFSNSQ